jgi:hypothetical protein
MFTKRCAVVAALWLCTATWVYADVTYVFTLTPTALGSPTPIFGISSLPAGPFEVSITLANPLPPSLPVTNEFGNVSAYGATIGTQSWDLGDLLPYVFMSTDASGDLATASFSALILPDTQAYVEFNTVANVGWIANQGGGCGLSGTPPLQVYGPCIGGDPSSVEVSVHTSAPEPATLTLLAIGLGGLAAFRRRRSASANGYGGVTKTQ